MRERLIYLPGQKWLTALAQILIFLGTKQSSPNQEYNSRFGSSIKQLKKRDRRYNIGLLRPTLSYFITFRQNSHS